MVCVCVAFAVGGFSMCRTDPRYLGPAEAALTSVRDLRFFNLVFTLRTRLTVSRDIPVTDLFDCNKLLLRYCCSMWPEATLTPLL